MEREEYMKESEWVSERPGYKSEMHIIERKNGGKRMGKLSTREREREKSEQVAYLTVSTLNLVARVINNSSDGSLFVSLPWRYQNLNSDRRLKRKKSGGNRNENAQETRKWKKSSEKLVVGLESMISAGVRHLLH